LATLLIGEAQEEAHQIVDRGREKAEQQAEVLRQQARQEVEKERAHILSQTDQQPQPAEEIGHFEEAVGYIVDVVSGQREGEA
jgi:vacuolar-type H+-ATPase subunit H